MEGNWKGKESAFELFSGSDVNLPPTLNLISFLLIKGSKLCKEATIAQTQADKIKQLLCFS